MALRELPAEQRGKWIWYDDRREKVEDYGFFFKDFILDEIPGVANLWIAAGSFFHLYMNGEHIGYGYNVNAASGGCAYYFDVGHLLETGRNTVQVQVYNARVANGRTLIQESGLWCQLNIDDEPTIWTDSSWQATPGTCYSAAVPRQSPTGGFTEKIDFHYFDNDWNTATFDPTSWLRATERAKTTYQTPPLSPFEGPAFSVEELPFPTLASQGTYEQEATVTDVSFRDAFVEAGRPPGAYCARAYVYCKHNSSTDFELNCDNAYKFAVNGKCVKSQSVKDVSPGGVLHKCQALPYKQDTDVVEPEGRVHFKQGWNLLEFCQEVHEKGGGMTLILFDVPPNQINFVQNPDNEAASGWATFGPLQAPLHNLFGTISTTWKAEHSFDSSQRNPVNEAARLQAARFSPEQEEERLLEDNETIELKSGDFAVFDLGYTAYGCPQFSINGPDNAVINVFSGTELFDSHVIPYAQNCCNCDTLLLSPKRCTWTACHCRGLRYIMITARCAHSGQSVRINGPLLKTRQYELENNGEFTSSNETYNQIWTTGRFTLDSVMQETFIDSPSHDVTQYIADSMIESWTAAHTFGDFSLSERALRQFATSQFETGEMPAATPSDLYMNIADYPLLWPVWLYKHYFYSGNIELINDLLPQLRQLFAFYQSISYKNTELLGYLEHRFGSFCFLDHGDIDRRGVVTGLNALYCRALLCAVELYRAAGQKNEADEALHKAGRIARRMRETTWDPERGLFADCWTESNGQSSQFSTQSNVLAIYGSLLADPSEYSLLMDRLFQDAPPYEQNETGALRNPYFLYFVLETAFALGKREWALDLMEWYWAGMLENGARNWWELYDPTSDDPEMTAGDKCTGYGCSPNGFLMTELAGIRPAKPGFSSVYFDPLVKGAGHVKARVPTPRGHITVEWSATEEKELDVTLTASYPVDIIPCLAPSIAEQATINVNDNVNIYAIEDTAT